MRFHVEGPGVYGDPQRFQTGMDGTPSLGIPGDYLSDEALEACFLHGGLGERLRSNNPKPYLLDSCLGIHFPQEL